jgi:flagellar assembly factor FliW
MMTSTQATQPPHAGNGDQSDPRSSQPGRTVRTDEATTTANIPVLEMVEPLLGFPERRDYALIRLDDDGVVCALRSLDEPDLRFVVVPPAGFFPDYAPEIDDATAKSLGATSAEDLLVLVMVNTADSAETATANLLAPVVVNHRTRRAVQVVLHDESLSLRTPLMQTTPEDARVEQTVR